MLDLSDKLGREDTSYYFINKHPVFITWEKLFPQNELRQLLGRITISLEVGLLVQGKGFTDIIQQYPDPEAEDIKQALKYAAWLARE